MTPLYRCPWCVVVKRGLSASAIMRKHILERHRAVLIEGLAVIGSFTTRHVGDYPGNGAKPDPGTNHTHASGMPCRCGANAGVSGEGDS